MKWPLGSPAESFHRTPDTQQWKPLGALTIKMLHDMVFDGGHQAGRAALELLLQEYADEAISVNAMSGHHGGSYPAACGKSRHRASPAP